MRRVIAVFLILVILLPVLLLPAAAADSEEYVFERMETQFYATATPISNNAFVLYEYLPPGTYQLDFVFNPEVVALGVNFHLFQSFFTVTYLNSFSPLLGPYLYYDLILDGVFELGNMKFSGAATSTIFTSPNEGITYFTTESPIISYVQKLVLTKASTVNDELDFFFKDLTFGLMSFSGNSLITVILFAIGIVIIPVFLWFGYRYMKRRIFISFKKGKV